MLARLRYWEWLGVCCACTFLISVLFCFWTAATPFYAQPFIDTRTSIVSAFVAASAAAICWMGSKMWIHVLGHLAILALFLLPLTWWWNSGGMDLFTIGGYFGLSDASNYRAAAHRLEQGIPLSAPANNRPFFSGFLGVVWWVVDQRAPLGIFFLAILNGISATIAAWFVRRQFGSVATIFFLVGCFLFHRRFAHSTMTEQLGLCLGLLSVAGACFAELPGNPFVKRVQLRFVALFLLGMALFTRAGAMFVIPAYAFWIFWQNRRDGIQTSNGLFWLVLTVSLPPLLNSFLLHLIAEPRNSAAANFSYTFYGLVHGTNWGDAYAKFGDKRDLIMQMAWEQLAQHPSVALKSGWLAIWNYFAGGEMVSFIGDFTFPALVFKSLIWLGCAACIWFVRDQNFAKILLLVLVGMLASMPFAPYWDVDYGRVYASTVPWLLLFPCFAIARMFRIPPKTDSTPANAGIFVVGAVIILLFVAPIALKLAAPAFGRPPGYALDNGDWRVDLRSHLRITANKTYAVGHFTRRQVSASVFQDGSNWDGRSWKAEHEAFRLLPGGVILTSNNIDNSIFIVKDRWDEGAVVKSYIGSFTRIQRGEHGFFIDADLPQLASQISALPKGLP